MSLILGHMGELAMVVHRGSGRTRVTGADSAARLVASGDWELVDDAATEPEPAELETPEVDFEFDEGIDDDE